MPDTIYILIILALFIAMLQYRGAWRKAKEDLKATRLENAELQQALDSVLRKR